MMQKISGILPSNSRITTVDVANSKPMRSGVPGFGVPVSAPTSTERLIAPTAVDMIRFSKEAEQRAMRPKGDVEIAQNLERDFFNTREQQLTEIPGKAGVAQERAHLSVVV